MHMYGSIYQGTVDHTTHVISVLLVPGRFSALALWFLGPAKGLISNNCASVRRRNLTADHAGYHFL